MFKKILAISIVLVMVLPFAACNGGDREGNGLPSAEEIIEKAVQALDDIKTYQFEMNVIIGYAGEAEGEVLEATMTIDSDGTMDLENGQMKMEIIMTIVSPGILDMEVETDIYIIDGMLYKSAVIPGILEGAEWQKSEVPQGYWEDIEQIVPQLELLELAQVEVIGTEEIDGIDCYVLQLTPDLERLWQILVQQMTAGEMEEEPDMDMELLQDMFKEFSVKQWITKDTYFIARADMNMVIEATPEAMGSPEEEGVVTMDITMDLLAYNYNQPVSIVLPPGAEEAAELSTSLGIVEEANTEAHIVEIAVLAAMVDNDVYELTAGGTVGPGYTSAVFAGDGVTELDMTRYFTTFLEATYILDKDGNIIAATPTAGGRWDGITYIAYQGWSE
jgi:hypothetical protein